MSFSSRESRKDLGRGKEGGREAERFNSIFKDLNCIFVHVLFARMQMHYIYASCPQRPE